MQLKVNWLIGWGNDPEIVLEDYEVTHIPFKYFKKEVYKGIFMYISICGMYGNFYLSTSDKSGYDGIIFRLPMQDGTVEDIVGPWSSRTSVANKFLEEKYHLKEVRGLHGAGYITVEKIRSLLPEDVELVKDTSDDEIRYRVMPKPGTSTEKMLKEKKPDLFR